MDKKTALNILMKSYDAQNTLISIFNIYLIDKIKEDKNRDDLDGKIYKGVFNSYHTIMNTIQNQIFKEYPELKKIFEEEIENSRNT